MTHEEFIDKVRGAILDRVHPDIKARIEGAKLTYGPGQPGVRGITYYKAWQNGKPEPCDFVGICATGEESITQLVGTTLHELGHVVAGSMAGHGAAWKDSCKILGLTHADAAGQGYIPEHFDAGLWIKIVELGQPIDGNPSFSSVGGLPFHGMPTQGTYRPCPLGIGVRGGKSRGKGSGSRLRLFQCDCIPAIKARVASDTFDATCNQCKTVFKRAAPPVKGREPGETLATMPLEA